MGLFTNGRVNIVITHHLLRYSLHKNTNADGVVTHGEMELPDGVIVDGKLEDRDRFIQLLNRLVNEQNWKRKKLFFTIPDDTIVIRQQDVPASLEKDEAVKYVKTQVGTNIYLPFGNPAVAIDFLEQADGKQQTILYAYPKDKLTEYETAFEKAGLKPMVADLTSLSVYRYYYLNYQPKETNVLLVHWNSDSLVLTAFQNHKAVFSRYMKTSVAQNASEESVEQVISENLIEINRIIDFYQFSITKGEQQIERILLTGDFPALDSVKLSLGENAGALIESFAKEELGQRYIDVLGLAMKKEI